MYPVRLLAPATGDLKHEGLDLGRVGKRPPVRSEVCSERWIWIGFLALITVYHEEVGPMNISRMRWLRSWPINS
jgi:hypothetical protein